MLATRLVARGFRNLAEIELDLGDGVTLIRGPNGAGKTNLLEALCFALTGASWRTSADRELIGFDVELARSEVTVTAADERRHFAAVAARGEGCSRRLDGKPLNGDARDMRPAVAVFSPDRLALVKGPPQGRRRHLDRLVAALWPGRADARRRYGRALAQRNALLAGVRGGTASQDALAAWDAELAVEAGALVEARAETVARVARSFGSNAGALGLKGEATIAYRPRTGVADAETIAGQLRERRAADVERGHSTHGPHLDEVELALGGRSLRRYGSQGEQRIALLALLFSERNALLEARRAPPLLLLDDVMSELDPERRLLLVELLSGDGQALLTATESSQVPREGTRAEVEIRAGSVSAGAPAG